MRGGVSEGTCSTEREVVLQLAPWVSSDVPKDMGDHGFVNPQQARKCCHQIMYDDD